MKNRFARNGKRKALSLRNLSIAAIASLAFIGVSSHQSAMAADNSAAINNTPRPLREKVEFVNEQCEFTNSGEGVDVSDKIANLNIGKDGLATGLAAEPTHNLPSLYEGGQGWVLNQTSQTGNPSQPSLKKGRSDFGGLATGFAAAPVPTLDGLHAQDPEAHPEESAYTLTETEQTEGDYILNIPEYSPETQTVTDKYYEINIKDGVESQTRLSNTTDHSATNYIGHYIGQSVSGNAEIYGGAIYNFDGTNMGTGARLGNIIGDFIANNASAIGNISGGAIYNRGYLGNITGDFIANSANSTGTTSQGSATGGAIYSHLGKIGDINGNFIANSANRATNTNGTHWSGSAYGGAIYSSSSTIGDITGDFIANSAITTTDYSNVGYGGAIYSVSGTIGDITGNFINNNATGTTSNGGAIYNSSSTIGNITGNFIGNSSLTQSSSSNCVAYGGAIYNNAGTIGDITGDFVGNTAGHEYKYSGASAAVYGGAIYNSGTIGNITGNFINNIAKLGTYHKGNGYGAAIYNTGEIGEISGDFIGNFAKSVGGAIFTTTDMTLVADAVEHVIKGNYTNLNNNKRYEAIYVSSSNATFTVKALNGGSWTIDDYISGYSGYGLTFTGDGTGVINYNNTISSTPNVTIDNVTFDQTDGVIRTYTLNTLTSNDGKLAVDINQDTKTADKFTTSGAANGTIYLSELNITGEGNNNTYQILNKKSGDAELAFADGIKAYIDGEEVEFKLGQAFDTQTVDNTVNYGNTYEGVEGFALGTTKTANDSVVVVTNPVYDQILTYLNQKVTDEERNFNFLTSSDVYTVTEFLGDTTAGTLNINGVAGENGELSTIDFNRNNGFKLNSATTLNIENTLLTNANTSAISVINTNAEVELTNVDFKNNTASNGGAIYNNSGTIGEFFGDFTGNSASNSGGAIYNNSTMSSITGNFANNTASTGGAIYNHSTMGNITGNFTNNTARKGGAIYNDGTIGDISGTFANNTTTSSNWGDFGGAIYNEGTIGNISGDFTNNTTASYNGGAIYNYNGTIGVISGDFIGNSARSYGGAIYTTRNMTLTADGVNNLISGNWVGTGDNKRAEAIYVSNSSATLTIKAENNGSWTIDDYINGISSGSNFYTILFTGDDTGVINYNNTVLNRPNLKIQNVTFNQADGVIRNYELNTLTSSNGKLSIDIDFDSNQADSFTTTNSSGNGTIYLSVLNFLGEKHDGVFQILNLNGDGVQLAFGDNIKVIRNGDDTNPEIGPVFSLQNVDDTVTFGDIYTSTEGLTLATTNTTNDSIAIQSDAVFDQILTYINQKFTDNERNFNFTNSAEVYKVTEPIGITADGTLNINGVAGENGELSTIDFNGEQGFYLGYNPVKLNIENTKITNANTAIGAERPSQITLNNVVFENNFAEGLGGALHGGENKAISGKFINNDVTETYVMGNTFAYGGAIYNNLSIGNLAADFEGNTAISPNGEANGGAIFNEGTIGFPQPVTEAVYDKLVITDDNGNVIITLYNSYIEEIDNEIPLSLSEVTSGDYNFTQAQSYKITEAEFIDEFYNGEKPEEGQTEFDLALNSAAKDGFTQVNPEDYNAPEPTPGAIVGNFINNHVEGAHADGGAIYNVGAISEIRGDFISNYGHSTGTMFTHAITSASIPSNPGGGPKDNQSKCGGAIYNSGLGVVIGNITGNFTDNRYLADFVAAYGGAIFNANGATIGNIDGDFTGNYTIGSNDIAAGGAIYNAGYDVSGSGNGGFEALRGSNSRGTQNSQASTIGDLNGNYTNNYAHGTAAMGGAIYNGGGSVVNEAYALTPVEEGGRKDGSNNNQTALTPRIGNITGNFTGNNAISTWLPENPDDDTLTGGDDIHQSGAIYDSEISIGENFSEIALIDDKINETSNIIASAAGGAIYNENAKIGNITGDFRENYAEANVGNVYGGAIANVSDSKLNADIGIVSGDDSTEKEDAGKSVRTRDLVDEEESLNSKIVLGKIGTISGEYDGNGVKTSDDGNTFGGAIFNNSNIENIKNSLFQNNFAEADSGNAYGGAIANDGNIGLDTPLNQAEYQIINITDKDDNLITTLYRATFYDAETDEYIGLDEQAISNGQYHFSDDVEEITVTLEEFINGGAIALNDGDQSATSESGAGSRVGMAKGGDLEPEQTPEEMLNEFIARLAEDGDYLTSVNPAEYSVDLVSTGADSIINSSFKNNYVKSTNGKGYGGAIYTTKDLMLTSKDEYEFLIDGNYVEDKDGTRPEAIYVDAGQGPTLVEGAESFEDNVLYPATGGDAISMVDWTRIYKDVLVDNSESPVPTLTFNATENGKFIINDQIVGSLDTTGTQGTLTYSENPYRYEYQDEGHEVYNEQTGQNEWTYISAIYDSEADEWYETECYGYKTISGTYFTYYDKSKSEWVTLLEKKEDFFDPETGEAVDFMYADAYHDNGNTYYFIWNPDTDEQEIVLTVENTGEKVYLEYDEDKGIYIEAENPEMQTIKLGNRKANLTIDGGKSGEVYINNNIKNLNITHDNVTTTVSDYMFLNRTEDGSINSLTMNSGILNLGSMSLTPLQFEMFGINGGTINIASVDVDLANKIMGRITADEYAASNGGTIRVHAFNLLSDGVDLITPVAFADESFKNTVVSTVTEAFTPIYRYEVEYDTNKQYGQDTEEGYFVFKRSNQPLPPDPPSDSDSDTDIDIDIDIDTDLDTDLDMDVDSDTDLDMDTDADIDNDTDTDADNDTDSDDDPNTNPTPTPGGGGGHHLKDFNPAILASPVAIQIAGQATMNQAFQYVFEHADAFTQMPAIDRFARIHNNEYALSTDFNSNLGGFNAPTMNKGVWVRPYTSFDKTDLKNGPEVESVNYGTIIGADTDFRKLRNGWTNVGTGYIGYFGSQVNFRGADISMNGGLLGLTETFYKGNFFTALTASAGGGFAESHTMYGKDELTTLMAGVASKTGYNFEFKEGRFIVQPILKMDYTMINTFDYTNAAGVRIDNKPMHTIQINPSVRFIGNLKGGWQPYASVGMVWNLMNETDVRANGVELPSMRTKPYIEYGVGVQRHWNDRFTAFGQAMVRNGGRTGVAFTAGFRWALGKDESKGENEKNVKHNEPVKVIKGERSQSTGAAVTTEPTEAIELQPLDTQHLLYKSKPLTKEEIAAREANLKKYNDLIK